MSMAGWAPLAVGMPASRTACQGCCRGPCCSLCPSTPATLSSAGTRWQRPPLEADATAGLRSGPAPGPHQPNRQSPTNSLHAGELDGHLLPVLRLQVLCQYHKPKAALVDVFNLAIAGVPRKGVNGPRLRHWSLLKQQAWREAGSSGAVEWLAAAGAVAVAAREWGRRSEQLAVGRRASRPHSPAACWQAQLCILPLWDAAAAGGQGEGREGSSRR